MSIQCPTCQASNPEGVQHCGACGSPLYTTGQKTIPLSALHLQPSTVLKQGRYQIYQTLGEGGFGITYQGIDTQQNRTVAIKEYWPERASRQGLSVEWSYLVPPKEKREQIQRVIDEASNLRRCPHSNIVKVYDCFEENQTAYIVMDFVPGRSLAQIIRETGKLSEDRAKRYFLQLANALKIVHAANLLHRDIKPNNVIIDANDQAILIDFGSAREFIAGKTNRMTEMLTHGYAPPEQYIQTAQRSESTDMYSLTASMYEALTGQVPPNSVTRQAPDPLISPRRLVPELDPWLEQILLIGLRVDARTRFQNADEFIDAVEKGIVPSLRQARQCVAAGRDRFSDAVVLYQRTQADYADCPNPEQGQAAVEWLLVLSYLNDLPQMESVAEVARQFCPQDARIDGALGLGYCRQGNGGEAIKHLHRAALQAPDQAWIQANLAWAYSLVENRSEAEAALATALQLDQNLPFALGLKAWLAAQKQDWQTTLQSARRSLWLLRTAPAAEREPLQQWIYPCLAIALHHLVVNPQAPDLDRALQEFLAQVPNTAFVSGFEGWRSTQKGQWSTAVAQFDAASRKAQVPDWILLNFGIACEQLGDVAGAIQAYDLASRKLRRNGVAWLRRGTLFAKQGLWEQARSCLEKAVQIDPKNAIAHHNLAWVLLNLRSSDGGVDHPQAVRKAYQQAIELYEQQGEEELAAGLRQALMGTGVF